ncbi:MAG: DUF2226 domain-containing protein [Candidatus Diapherotrites archaeon]|nr:DUF2226 domain-containing protein [Candidatus Diapherotrites archaeon]
MNLPVGNIVAEGKLSKETILKELPKLMDEKFTGYFLISIDGCTGIEEGLLLLKLGKIIGAVFEYLRFSKELYGDEAAKHFFNACASNKGVFEADELSLHQVDLILAFNDEVQLTRELESRDISKLVPDEYSSVFAEKFLGDSLQTKEVSRYLLLRKIGIV